MWRGSQQWVWMAPNHVSAIVKVLLAEVPLLRWLTNRKEITFQVTQKTGASTATPPAGSQVAANTQQRLAPWCYAYLVYYAAVAACLVSIVVHAALGRLTYWQGVLNAAAFGWASVLCLMMWPPVSTLLPREETEQGWKVRWDQFLHIPESFKQAASATVSLFSPAGSDHSQWFRPRRHSSNSAQSPRPVLGEPQGIGQQECLPPSRLGLIAPVSGGLVSNSQVTRTETSQHATHSQDGAAVGKQQSRSPMPIAVESCMLPLTGNMELDAALPAAARAMHGVSCLQASSKHEAVCSPTSGSAVGLSSHQSVGHTTAQAAAHLSLSAALSGKQPLAPPHSAAIHRHNSCSAAAVAVHHPGMVSLPGHTQLFRGASALLTGLVLPERPAHHHPMHAMRNCTQDSLLAGHLAGADATVSLSTRHTRGSSGGERGVSLGAGSCSSAAATVSAGYSSGGGQQAVLGDVYLSEHLHAQAGAAAQLGHHVQGPVLLVGPHGEVGPCPLPLALACTARVSGSRRGSSLGMPPHRSGSTAAATLLSQLDHSLARVLLSQGSGASSIAGGAASPHVPAAEHSGITNVDGSSQLLAGDTQGCQTCAGAAEGAVSSCSAGPCNRLSYGAPRQQALLAPLAAAMQGSVQHPPHRGLHQPTLAAVEESRSLHLVQMQPAGWSAAAAGGDVESQPPAPSVYGTSSDFSHLLQQSLMMLEEVDGGDTPLQLLPPSQLFLRPHLDLAAAETCSQSSSSAAGGGCVGGVQGIAAATQTAGSAVREARESIGTLAQFLAGQLAGADASHGSSCTGGQLEAASGSGGGTGCSISSAAMLVPTEPATIFEASIAARPNFEDRQQPPECFFYHVVNSLIMFVLVAGAVVELTTGKHL